MVDLYHRSCLHSLTDNIQEKLKKYPCRRISFSEKIKILKFLINFVAHNYNDLGYA